jgi:hypothetical protein
VGYLLLVSERLLFNANSVIFQLYHGKNKLIFNEMMMRSALYLTNMLSWILLCQTTLILFLSISLIFVYRSSIVESSS